MKNSLKLALIAALAASALSFSFADGERPPLPPEPTERPTPMEVRLVEILTPHPQQPRIIGLSEYATATLDLATGALTIDFYQKIDNIIIQVDHSELGGLALVNVDYELQPSITIPIPNQDGTYSIYISGCEYEAVGEHYNY